MRHILFLFLDAGFATVLLLPVFLLLNRRCFHDRKRTAWYFLMAVYICAVYAVVGLPDILYIRLDLNINLVPFAYMFSDYRSSSLNVLLFLPLGFFLPVLWRRFKGLGWTLLFGFCLSLLIELLQIFTFRATDINDLMTNTFGTLLGWCLGRLALRLVPGLDPGKNTQDVFTVCGISFGIMFFLQPLLSNFVMGYSI